MILYGSYGGTYGPIRISSGDPKLHHIQNYSTAQVIVVCVCVFLHVSMYMCCTYIVHMHNTVSSYKAEDILEHVSTLLVRERGGDRGKEGVKITIVCFCTSKAILLLIYV